jgi:predicted nucleotidyltransferase
MLLREKDRLRLIEIFGSCPLAFEVWAYGSRVNNTAHNASDLDLVLRTEKLEAMPQSEYLKLVDKIKNSQIPILVELRDWARIPDSFRKQIVKQYELLYSSQLRRSV